MTEEVKETVRRIFWEAYSPLLGKLSRDTRTPVEELFEEMITTHIGGWDMIYYQAQTGLDAGVSLGEQEREVKKISKLFEKLFK
jgi:hypothetical protein